jgi:predicted aspartyl protease
VAVNQPLISDRFPYLPVVITIFGVEVRTEALIDTGFDGHLIVPAELLSNLTNPPPVFFDGGWEMGLTFLRLTT